MGSEPDKVEAPKVDIAKDIKKYVEGLSKQLPNILNLEQQYRPQFQQSNLQDIYTFLSGAPGTQGLMALGGQYGQQAGEQINSLRQQELSGMQGNVGAVRNVLQSLSPEGAQQIGIAGNAQQQAADAYNQFATQGAAMLRKYSPDTTRAKSTIGGIKPNVDATISLGGPSSTLGGLNTNAGQTMQQAGAQADMASRMAQDAYIRSQGLTPQEKRTADQQSRESYGTRGMLDSNASVASEILNRDSFLEQKRDIAANRNASAYEQQFNVGQGRYGQAAGNIEREMSRRNAMYDQQLAGSQLLFGQQQGLYNQRAGNVDRQMGLAGLGFNQDMAARQGQLEAQSQGYNQFLANTQMGSGLRGEAAQRSAQAYDMAQGYYSPGLQALSAAPLSYAAGQQQLGYGLGSIGAGVPQLFNIDAALNIGAANRANQVAAQSANAQAQAAYGGGLFGGIGGALGGIGQGLGAYFASDRRLKADIELIGKTPGGFNKYLYRYKNDPSQRYIGVMADDVEKVMPEAVITRPDGYKAVNYSLIH